MRDNAFSSDEISPIQTEIEVLYQEYDNAQSDFFFNVMISTTDFMTTLKANLYVYKQGLCLIDANCYRHNLASGEFVRYANLWSSVSPPEIKRF